MRGLLMGCVAAGFSLLVACGSDCNNDCQQCRDQVAVFEAQCEAGCGGDAECRDICQTSSCQGNDACDGEIEDACN